MHPRAEEFAELAREEYEFEVDVHEFPEGTKTAADAAAAIGCDVAEIASSIVFEVDGDPVVVVTSGANRVSEAKLASVKDVSESVVSIADADTIKSALGWSIGGVPPFCHESEVPVLLDETLLDFETVWAASGTPKAVFPIAPGTLREFADARPADVAE